jgi:hypothetical protein
MNNVKVGDRVRTGVFPQWMKNPREYGEKEFQLPKETVFEVIKIHDNGKFDVVNLLNDEEVNNCTSENFENHYSM